MYYIIKLLQITVLIGVGYFLLKIHKKANVKNMDEFQNATLLRKIDMIFTEEDDLLNSEKWKSIITMVMILTLLIKLIIDCFK